MTVLDLKVIIERLDDDCDVLLKVVGAENGIIHYEEHPVIEVHYVEGGQMLYVSSYI